jgi:hypothetical protein
MTAEDIIRHRLLHQQIAKTRLKTPQQVVAYMGAMQAQEYAMAKWAIALRLPEGSITNAEVEKAFNSGKILRTHMMRPTWHFVAPKEIRWMLKITSPAVQKFNAYYYKKDSLDSKVFKRCNDIIAKALEGKNYQTREELREVLAQHKIEAAGTRLAGIMMNAELEGLVCSGPRKGKQFTYALIDERAPADNTDYTQEEGLYHLATKYFSTRGPASAQDFSWWSGLNAKDAKQAMDMLDKKFKRVTIDKKEYAFLPVKENDISNLHTTFLLPDYDEYGISYKDRSAYDGEKVARDRADVFSHMVVVDGKMAGTWTPNANNKATQVKAELFTKPDGATKKKLEEAVKRYEDFFGN